MTVREILTALINNILEGIIRLGCGLGGLDYDPDTTWSATLPNLFK